MLYMCCLIQFMYILLNHVLVRFLINKIEIYCFDSVEF